MSDKPNELRQSVLNTNKAVRDNGGAGELEWGRSELHIPELDFYVLVHRFPELNSPDNEIQHKAWKKFLNSPAALPYKVQPKFRNGIIMK